jgi:hypothetical protein
LKDFVVFRNSGASDDVQLLQLLQRNRAALKYKGFIINDTRSQCR